MTCRAPERSTSHDRRRRALRVLLGVLALGIGAVGLTACTTSSGATTVPIGTPVQTAIPTLIIVTPTPAIPGQPAATSESVPANPTPDQSHNGENGSYTVQPGDTLYTIAVKFNVTIQALMAANSIEDPTTLQAGQVIAIP